MFQLDLLGTRLQGACQSVKAGAYLFSFFFLFFTWRCKVRTGNYGGHFKGE